MAWVLALVIGSVLSNPAAATTCTVNIGNPATGTAPKLCDCPLGANFPAFGNCVNGKIGDALDDAVDAANAAKQTTINTLNSQLQKPWVAAMNQIDASALTTCLSTAGIQINQSIAGVASNPVPFVRSRLTDLWQKSMANPMLAQRFNASMSSKNLTTSQRMDAAEALFGQLAAQDPAAQCAWTATAPFRSQVKAMALEVFPTVKVQYDALIEQRAKPADNQAIMGVLQPALRQAVATAAAATERTATTAGRAASEASRQVARSVGSHVPPDVRQIALAVTLRHMLDPARVNALNEQLNSLAGAVSMKNASGVTTALSGVESALTNVATLSNAGAIEVGLETLRFYGHSLINTEGPDVIDQAYVTVNDVTLGVINLVTGVVELWYEPAAAVGEVATFVVGAALFPTKPIVSNEMIARAHQSFDMMIDAAARAVRERRPPGTYAANAGPFAPMLATFPTEAELLQLAVPEVAQMQNVLSGYHASVRALARAASGTDARR